MDCDEFHIAIVDKGMISAMAIIAVLV